MDPKPLALPVAERTYLFWGSLSGFLDTPPSNGRFFWATGNSKAVTSPPSTRLKAPAATLAVAASEPLGLCQTRGRV